MNKQRSGKKKKDALLLIFILAAAAVLFIIFFFMNNKSAENVVIKVNGNIVYSAAITKDADLTINGYDGGYNKVKIANSSVTVTDADCPDDVCVNTGAISRSGQTIVCLPHKMVIEITGANAGLDSLVK